MGASCKSCGGPGEEALQDMNKKGIFTPKQITAQLGGEWELINVNGDKKVSKKDLEKICKNTVVMLGKNGGSKEKFQSKKFNELVSDQFSGVEEFDRKQSTKIVTQLLSKDEAPKQRSNSGKENADLNRANGNAGRGSIKKDSIKAK